MIAKHIARLCSAVYFSLWAALLLLCTSFLGIDSSWRIMRIDPPRWTEVPGAVEFVAPHERVLEFLIGIWHGMVQTVASANWIQTEDAADLIENGVSIAGLLRFLAVLCFLYALWQISVARVRTRDAQSAPTTSEPVSVVKQEPALPQAVIGQDRLDLMSRSLSQAGLTVTNLMLDPQAEQFSEELADAATKIQSIAQELAQHARPASGS